MRPYKSQHTRFYTMVLGLFAFTMSAYSGDARNTPPSGKSEAFKVALLTPGSISDQSPNGGAYDGLMAIRDSLGAKEESKGVRVIGSNSNQNNVAPNVMIASVVIDLPRAFLEVAREIRIGKFIPRVISLGLHDDVVRLVLNPRISATVPKRIRIKVGSARTALIDGTLKLPHAQ